MPRFLCYVGLLSTIACTTSKPPVTVVIDAGHMPSAPGALGICKKTEVDYNDEVAAALNSALKAHKYKTILTREPGKEVQSVDPSITGQLRERAAIANNARAKLFISIHHDSIRSTHLETRADLCAGQSGTAIKKSFKAQHNIGFNIFVSKEMSAERKAQALELAKLIGAKLIAAGRIASDFHTHPLDDCKSCEPVDKSLGIWQQDLAVLRLTQMPALLIEVGTIVHEADEAIVNNNNYRKSFAAIVAESIDEYFSKPQM